MRSHTIDQSDLLSEVFENRLVLEVLAVLCQERVSGCSDRDHRDDLPLLERELATVMVQIVFENHHPWGVYTCSRPLACVGPGVVFLFEGWEERG